MFFVQFFDTMDQSFFGGGPFVGEEVAFGEDEGIESAFFISYNWNAPREGI